MANRINKTEKNLEILWKQLDDACGAIDNATFNIAHMVDMPEEVEKMSERIDFSLIVSLKNEIERMIEEKQNKKVVK